MIDNGLYVDKELTRHSSVESFVLAAGPVTQIAKASAKRVRITFVGDGVFAIRVSQINPLDGSREFRITATNPIFVMDKNDYGSFIQGNFFATAASGSPLISVIDTVEE